MIGKKCMILEINEIEKTNVHIDTHQLINLDLVHKFISF